jgi:hypothetical protein
VSALELSATSGTGDAGHDQIAVVKPSRRLILIVGAAVSVHVTYDEGDAICPELAIDKGQRGRICAIGAINTPDLIASDRELIGVRLTLVRPPAAAIIVGILGGGRVAHPHVTRSNTNCRFPITMQATLFADFFAVFHTNSKGAGKKVREVQLLGVERLGHQRA